MKQFLCELLFICAVSAPGAKPVDELTYRSVLFEHYQQRNEAALVGVLVAQTQQRRGADAVRFDLAKGSFAFAEGMYGYADEVFTSIPDEQLQALDRLRLAFHLARDYHRRQAWSRLSEQLARIDLAENGRGTQQNLRPQALHPEVQFMRAELAMHQAQPAQALELLQNMAVEAPLRAYGLFNLGVIYRQQNALDESAHAFQALADTPAYSKEIYDLSQRARLALAVIARQQQHAETAEGVLAGLPGEGRYRDVAMAAYGGLAMDAENYELAARIWKTLQAQGHWTPSTATARLGLPLSLEKLALTDGRANTQMALRQYEEAERLFMSRLGELETLRAEASDPQFILGMLQVFASDDRNDATTRAKVEHWQQRLGHTDWLEWLASERVQQGLGQWRQLNEMQQWLGTLPDHLHALDEVAQEQRRRTRKARYLLEDEGLLAQRETLVARTRTLADRLDALRQAAPERNAAWMVPLANAEERALLTDLAAKRVLLTHMNDVDQGKWLPRIDRLEGLVYYRIASSRAARLQVLRNQQRDLQGVLRDVDARVSRVELAENNFEAGVGANFAAFTSRADRISGLVDAARVSREQLLAGEIRGRMEQEMRQVEEYLLVTRMAIARATDLLAAAATSRDGS